MQSPTPKTALFAQWVQGRVVIVDQSLTTGNVFFVGSAVSGATDSTSFGRSPESPFATLDYAIGQCTANNGDLIIVLPGHSETFSTSATHVALDVAGIKVTGLGQGADRPTFTFSHTDATMALSANGVTLENLLFVTGVDSVTTFLTISGADATLKDIELRDTTDVEVITGITTTAAADRLTIDGLYHNGYTGGNACVTGLLLVGCDSPRITNSRWEGLFSTACIEFKTTACTKVRIDGCVFRNTGTAVTKDIVDTQGSSTWVATHCFDAVAGYECGGGDGQAFRFNGGRLLYATKTTTSPLPNNTNIDLFNYVGAIRIHEVGARVSTAIQNQTTNVKFQLHPSTDTAALDICAVLDMDNFVADSVVRITNDFSDALLGATDVASKEGDVVAAPILTYGAAAASALKLHSAAASTGALQVWCLWEPVSPGARLYAA